MVEYCEKVDINLRLKSKYYSKQEIFWWKKRNNYSDENKHQVSEVKMEIESFVQVILVDTGSQVRVIGEELLGVIQRYCRNCF